MVDTDYGLSHQVLNDLKQDVEALKKKIGQPDAKMNELLLEIDSLKDLVHDLNTIFQKVLDSTKTDDPNMALRTLIEKADALVSQNETIARGMVAVSDKLDELMRSSRGSSMLSQRPTQSPLYPVQHTLGVPAPPGPGRVAPRPMNQPLEIAPGVSPLPPPPSAQEQSLFEGSELPPPPSPPGKKRMGVFR